MNMPNEVILAVKEKKPQDQEKLLATKVQKISSLDKIIASYNTLHIRKDDYNKNIKAMRNNANRLKSEIYKYKNIKNNALNMDMDVNVEKKERFKKKIEDNNYSINEESCNSTIDYINIIRTNISSNSQVASEALTPLESSFKLLKAQVQYTVILEDIIGSFKERDQLEEKITESDQIIAMLAEALEIELLEQ